MAKGTKGGKTIVDFTGVDSGGRTRVPEDDYLVKVVSVKHDTSKSSGNPMLVWEFEIVDGKFAGKKLRDRTVLQENSLWKLKQLLEAMGVEVPSKRVALQLQNYIGRTLGVTTVDDEYEGRVSSKVADYVSLDVLEDVDDDDDDDEDEEPAPKKSKKGKKKSKKQDDDDDEEVEDLDLDEI